jgi:hypothetical protein
LERLPKLSKKGNVTFLAFLGDFLQHNQELSVNTFTSGQVRSSSRPFINLAFTPCSTSAEAIDSPALSDGQRIALAPGCSRSLRDAPRKKLASSSASSFSLCIARTSGLGPVLT